MKIFSNILLFVTLAICLASSHASGSEKTLPTGVTVLETNTVDGEFKKLDKGYPTLAADVGMGYFWLGRDGGVRRYDRITDEWKFFKYDKEKCPGSGSATVVVEPPYVWVRVGSAGRICRLDPETGEWLAMDHWTVLQHTGKGVPFAMDKYHYYVASSGGPDWEGISVIDRKSLEWMKLHKSKPPQSLYVDDEFIWAGVPEGILKIDKITEDYKYYQPFEHGGGALVKDILPLSKGQIAFATFGDYAGILGDELVIGKYFIKVYMKSSDRWYTYGKDERSKLMEDMQNGRIVVTNIKTHPGLLILDNEKWKLLDTKDGLPANDILDLEKDDRFLYISTVKGIGALQLNSYKPAATNPQITAKLKLVRRIIADKDYLWVFTNKELYKVVKRMLFSEPRPEESPE